jgi:hypothetical protein
VVARSILRWLSTQGAGRIYQQTFIDITCKVVHCKGYTTKTPITAADLLNDKVLPLYTSHDLPMLRILTDRRTEYCWRAEQHKLAFRRHFSEAESPHFELYLAVNDIDHTKTKPCRRRPTAFASASTRPFCRSFIK